MWIITRLHIKETLSQIPNNLRKIEIKTKDICDCIEKEKIQNVSIYITTILLSVISNTPHRLEIKRIRGVIPFL